MKFMKKSHSQHLFRIKTEQLCTRARITNHTMSAMRWYKTLEHSSEVKLNFPNSPTTIFMKPITHTTDTPPILPASLCHHKEKIHSNCKGSLPTPCETFEYEAFFHSFFLSFVGFDWAFPSLSIFCLSFCFHLFHFFQVHWCIVNSPDLCWCMRGVVLSRLT